MSTGERTDLEEISSRYATEDQANAAVDHATLERAYQESGTTLSPADWIAAGMPGEGVDP